MDVGRNAPCPCGSGRKYKACCAGTRAARSSRWAGALVALALLAGLFLVGWALIGGPGGAPDGPAAGKVWSEEHGHWH
ncbi:MAG TPA: SEC-C metal-binding domain-containing protein [Rubricoccaceae bacterium]|jgi:hypothetical protein